MELNQLSSFNHRGIIGSNDPDFIERVGEREFMEIRCNQFQELSKKALKDQNLQQALKNFSTLIQENRNSVLFPFG